MKTLAAAFENEMTVAHALSEKANLSILLILLKAGQAELFPDGQE